MCESPGVARHSESPPHVWRYRSWRWHLLGVLAVISASCMPVARGLPPDGTTRWEMDDR